MVEFKLVEKNKNIKEKTADGLTVSYSYKFQEDNVNGMTMSVKSGNELKLEKNAIIAVDFTDKQTKMKK